MAVHTAIGFILAGIGIIAQNWGDFKTRTKNSPSLLPAFVGLGMLALTLSFYMALVAHQRNNIQQTIDAHAETLENSLENGIRERIQALERMAERWTKRSGIPFEEWQSDAKNYNQNFKTFHAVEWVDSSFHVRWIEPLAGNEAALDFNLATEETRRSAFEIAIRQHQTIVSQTVDLKQGGRGILIYVPVYRGGEFDGFILGVSRIGTLLQIISPDTIKSHYSINISENNQDIYRSDMVTERLGKQWHAQSVINLPGMEWQADISPLPATLAGMESKVPEATLIAGILVSLLLGWTFYLLHKSRREVGERIRVEGDLSISEKRARDLTEKSPGFISTHDLESRILTVNPAAAHALGYDPEEVIGRLFSDFMPESKKHLMPAYFEQVCREREMTTHVPLLTKNGEPRIWKCSDVLYGDSGEKQYILGYAQDITDLKDAQKRLEQSEKRYRNLIDKSLGLICTHDLDGKILSVNPSGASALGYTPEELVELSLADIIAPETRHLFDKYLEKIKREGELSGFMSILAKDGGEKVWQYNNAMVTDDGGQPYVLGYAQDFTEYKRMDGELKDARDAALESARMKSEFLANMSHEIRTPMNGVMGMTELLLDTPLDEFQRNSAETIRTSADALLAIINDILDFSKIEAGKLNFETIDFDLRNAVESTVEIFAEQAADKRVEIASLVKGDVPVALRGDPGRLRQILTNLVGNAVKFTAHGEIVVHVEKETESDDDVRLRFSVRDTGIGIAPDAQKYLFQAFTQADGSTTRKFGGTGLGLAISKHLVEIMGGEIDLESEPGKGSVFNFTADFKKQLVDGAAKRAPLTDLANIRVLIVDDNATNRKILLHHTKSWGMVADQAKSGPAALEHISRAARVGKPYDLAILDLMMPELDGFEVARHIRSDAANRDMRLILMPSFGQRGHGRTARKTGIDAYLIKPVKQMELFDCIATIMGEKSVAIAAVIPTSLITRHTLEENRPLSEDRILIAEDNLVNQTIARLQLERLGYHTDVVGNGRLAIEALKQKRYALILMDCQMPEMDGYAATAEIRRNEQTGTHIPIVAVTAHAMQGAREKCLAAGMDDYLSKPFKQEDLAAVIKRWFDVEAAVAGDVRITVPAGGTDKNELFQGVKTRLDALEPEIGGEMINVIIALFIEDASARLENLQKAIEEKNISEVEREAHSLKGSCANVGATSIAELCSRIETEAESGELTDSINLLNKIVVSFPVLIKMLDGLKVHGHVSSHV